MSANLNYTNSLTDKKNSASNFDIFTALLYERCVYDYYLTVNANRDHILNILMVS